MAALPILWLASFSTITTSFLVNKMASETGLFLWHQLNFGHIKNRSFSKELDKVVLSKSSGWVSSYSKKPGQDRSNKPKVHNHSQVHKSSKFSTSITSSCKNPALSLSKISTICSTFIRFPLPSSLDVLVSTTRCLKRDAHSSQGKAVIDSGLHAKLANAPRSIRVSNSTSLSPLLYISKAKTPLPPTAFRWPLLLWISSKAILVTENMSFIFSTARFFVLEIAARQAGRLISKKVCKR